MSHCALEIETRVLENPGKPVHFAKPQTRVYDARKPGFRVCVFRSLQVGRVSSAGSEMCMSYNEYIIHS